MLDFPTQASPIKTILNAWLQGVSISWLQIRGPLISVDLKDHAHNAQQLQDPDSSEDSSYESVPVAIDAYSIIRKWYQTLVMYIRRGVAEKFGVCQHIT